MKTIYTVYQLNEKQNKLGNPYIGYTQNLITRARNWKSDLKLDYKPILIPLYFSTEELDAFNWEQPKRIELGWGVERCTFEQLIKMRKAAQVANRKHNKILKYRKTRLSEYQRLKICNLYDTIDGITGKLWDKQSLAQNYSVTKDTIHAILKKKNLLKQKTRTDKGCCRAITEKQSLVIKSLYNTKDQLGRKYTITYLSEKFNISMNTIHRVIKDKIGSFKD